MTPLEVFAPRNNEWVKMARSISPNYDEILQEAYLKLHDTFKNRIADLEGRHENELSMYMWLTLKSCNATLFKQEDKYTPLDNLPEEIEEEYIESKDIVPVLQKIEEEIRGFHWYDERLFRLHYEEGMPMREIARQTKISLSSIFHTLKTCRTRIKSKL